MDEEKEKMKIYPGLGITLTEPLTVSIDKEYFKHRFQIVFDRWEEDMKGGIGRGPQMLLLQEIMDCFNV